MSQFDQRGQHVGRDQFNAGRDINVLQYSGFPPPSFLPARPQHILNIAPERITGAWTYREREDVSSVTFCPGTQWLATAQQYRILNFWDVTKGERARTLTLSSRLESIAFSPDGQVLASFGGDENSTGEDDDTIKIWKVAKGQLLRTLKHPGLLIQVVFSPDGRWLASASIGEQYYIWDLAKWEVQQRLGGSNNIDTLPMRCPLAFNPDGQWLAGADKYGSRLTIWKVWSGDIVQTFNGLAYRGINDLAFSPDRQWLACASTNGAFGACAQLWNVNTGELVQTFEKQIFTCLAFSPDGQFLAIGGATTLALWEIV